MRNSEKLMEAMSGIRAEYLAAAGQEEMNMTNIAAIKRKTRVNRTWKAPAAIAAALLLSILLPNVSPTAAQAMGRIPFLGVFFQTVTIRDYGYADETHEADVEIPEVGVAADDTGDAADLAIAAQTAGEINTDIAAYAAQLEQEFKDTLESEGYSLLEVTNEVLTDSKNYYSIAVHAFTAQADGYERSVYYTIDKTTGKRVTLSDLYEGDYVSRISEEIRAQMIAEQEAGTGDYFIADYGDDPVDNEFGFREIAPDQSFYIDEAGNTVICFDEGDIAPMYMGEVQFTLDKSR